MLTEPPTFEIVGDGELTDAAVEALARLLLSLVEQDSNAPQLEKEEAQSA